MSDKTCGTCEHWKEIKGYEGFYLVSNLGNVKSVDRMIKTRYGTRIIKGKTLSKIIDSTGYERVNLSNGNKQKMISVHRLVACSFLPNKSAFPQVNHKNEVKTDNRVENLEWCDCIYNNNYGTRNDRMAGTKGIKVAQILDGQVVEVFQSMAEAQRQGFTHSGISRCCSGKLKTHRGYEWCRVDDTDRLRALGVEVSQ